MKIGTPEPSNPFVPTEDLGTYGEINIDPSKNRVVDEIKSLQIAETSISALNSLEELTESVTRIIQRFTLITRRFSKIASCYIGMTDTPNQYPIAWLHSSVIAQKCILFTI